MKNPFQKRVHEPQDPRQVMMQSQQAQKKAQDEARRKKAEKLVLPVLLEECESTLDGVIFVNTMADVIQRVVENKVWSSKLGDHDKEITEAIASKPRYQKIVETLKEEKMVDAINLLAEIKIIVNNSIDRKFSKTQLKDFVEQPKESGIILPK